MDSIVILLARDTAYIGKRTLGGHKIDDISSMQLIGTTRDDGLALTLDGNNMIGLLLAQLVDGNVEYQRALTQLYTQHHECTTAELPPLAYPAHLQAVSNLLSGQHFGVNQAVNTKILKELFIFGL